MADLSARIPAYRKEAAAYELRNVAAALREVRNAGDDRARHARILAAYDRKQESSGPVALLAREFGSVLQPVADIRTWMDAQDRLCRSSVRLLLLRKHTGAFPSRLPDFGRASIDPVSMQPLYYTTSENAFRLESSPVPGSVTTMRGFGVDFDGSSLRLD